MIAEKPIEVFSFNSTNRHYDPTIVRWTTKDPIGFEGMDKNLYAYFGGEPLSRIDPEDTIWNNVIGAEFDLGVQLYSNGGDLGNVS